MKIEPGLALDAAAQAALEELATIIRRQYPEASFRVGRGEDDPAIVQLIATVDAEDTEPVLDAVMERLLALHDDDVPIFVVTERPLARTLAMRAAATTQQQMAVPTTPG